jgi:AraC-like DNA-binding protein
MKSRLSTTKGGGNLPPSLDPDLAKWCAALSTQAATDEVPPGWLRMSELATMLGKSESHMAKLIRKAAEEGRCETAMFRVQCGQRVLALRHYKLK